MACTFSCISQNPVKPTLQMRKLRLTRMSTCFGQDHEGGGRSGPGSQTPDVVLCKHQPGLGPPTSFRPAPATVIPQGKNQTLPPLISLLRLLPPRGPPCTATLQRFAGLPVFFLTSLSLLISSQQGSFPEMAPAKVTSGFHDASSKGLFKILFFLILPPSIL